ncbi:unnamed protein product [Notodromas monacha]|uniref:Uncharacterized protein n=1 Tax=Notodromas monacha TaxID=399045 RepID=A0A7R9BNG5_9CRUS|nr:unnamed protein product [Notodromas monacha]CAG0918750.1 unnamed protein product [Notodromas monacha]
MSCEQKSSVGTVYFSDDMNDAKHLVEEVLARFSALIEESDDAQKSKIQSTIGLKIEELKAHLSILDATAKE